MCTIYRLRACLASWCALYRAAFFAAIRVLLVRYTRFQPVTSDPVLASDKSWASTCIVIPACVVLACPPAPPPSRDHAPSLFLEQVDPSFQFLLCPTRSWLLWVAALCTPGGTSRGWAIVLQSTGNIRAHLADGTRRLDMLRSPPASPSPSSSSSPTSSSSPSPSPSPLLLRFDLWSVSPPLVCVSSAFPLSDGNWHHVLLVVDRAAALASLFVDGALAASPVNTSTLTNVTSPLPVRVAPTVGDCCVRVLLG
jgi:hypothetical protein